MNPDDPDPEGPTSTHNLSLVSPKPLYYPSPANIPILENQNDPSFDHASGNLQALKDPNKDAQNGVDQTTEPTVKLDVSSNEDTIGTNNDGITERGLSAEGLQTTATSLMLPNGGEIENHRSSFGDHLQTQLSEGVNAGDFLSTSLNPETHHPTILDSTAPVSENYATQYDRNEERGDQNLAGQLPAGDFDYQKLLDNLSATASTLPHANGSPNHNLSLGQAGPTDVSNQAANPHVPISASMLQGLAGLASLPPRPPPQENTNNATHETDIRSYHLHDQPSSAQTYTTTTAASSGASFQPHGNLPPPILTAGAPGTSSTANSLPPGTGYPTQPNSATQATQGSPVSATYRQRDMLERRGSDDPVRKEDEDIPWGNEVQRQYDAFLESERHYVTEGQWDKFPANSRLFIGNLPTEKVTKRDLFHVFHKHGKLAQISIKQAYGFIQYLEASSCYRALQVEQGVPIRGRKINLEISKPQKNTKHSGGNANEGRGSRNRRSRSPDYGRGGHQKGADRYRGGGNKRNRDEHRSGRSPSPKARAGRDDFRRDGDRYNGRRRSRSRSPNRNRFRSPSPRRDMEDDCPLPRRKPEDVPDLQIIAKEDLDRSFISYVQKTFEGRGVRCNVLILSPRLSEPAVVRRQIIEGVLAVLTLDRVAQGTQKFSMSVFDRSGGANNVRFEDYASLELNICVELVLRARQNTQSSTNPTVNTYYGLPMAQALQQPPQQLAAQQQQYTNQYNPAQPVTNAAPFPTFDTSSLQQILGRVQQQNTPQSPPQQNAYTPQNQQRPGQLPPTTDLSRILAGAAARGQAQQPNQSYQQPVTSSPYQNLASNPAFAGLFGNAGTGAKVQQGQGANQPQSPPAQSQSPQQAQPDMRNIMAQLARYGR